jgi:hypothetical protein
MSTPTPFRPARLRSHEFDAIRNAIADKVAALPSADEAEKYSSALKSVTEAATAAESLDIQRRNIDLERLKSWATILVPLVSVLGLTVTIWTQAEQLGANRTSAEDSQWISTLTALTSGNNTTQAGLAYIERIKPFLANPRYSELARDMSVLTLGKMSDYDLFKDLFEATFPRPGVEDLPLLARISRSLNQNYDAGKVILDKWNEQLAASSHSPGRSVTVPTGPPSQLSNVQLAPSFTQPRRAQPGIPLASEKDNLEHAQNETYREVVIVADLIADLLRRRSSDRPLDLSEGWFPTTDLHDANLSNVDITGTSIGPVNLKGADLHGIHLEYLEGVRWWQAKYLEKNTIESLIKTSYPYSFNEPDHSGPTYSSDEKVTPKDYQDGVNRLCRQVGCNIANAELKIGPLHRAEADNTSDTPKP